MIFLYRLGQWLARGLPERGAYWLGARLADLYRWCAWRDARVVRENLRAVLGDDRGRVDHATRELFRQFSGYLVEFFRIRTVDRAFIASRVEVTGLEHLTGAIADGRGAIVLAAHLGNWELAGGVIHALGVPISAVALNHPNPRVTEFFNRRRRAYGLGVIPMGQATRPCLTALRQRRVVALLADRDFSHHAAVSVPFFGRLTWIPRGPAVLSVRTRRPVVPVFLVRLQPGRFRLICEPAIPPPETADDEATVEALTRQYVAVMERVIRAYPAQWFLFHAFWHPWQSHSQTAVGVPA